MGWLKRGRIFDPNKYSRPPHLSTHASNPVALHLDGGLFRVFYSGRDHSNRSSVGHFDFDFESMRLVDVCTVPDFASLKSSNYFSHGVSISAIQSTDEGNFLWFMGWHIPDGQHWQGELGRLRIASDLSLHLVDPEPAIGINPDDPISLSYPTFLKLEDGTWACWYGSTIAWDIGNGEMLHVIRRATSINGIFWKPEFDFLPWSMGTKQAFSRPHVIRNDNDHFEMWFSFRGAKPSTYRIGHAESEDGRGWTVDLTDCLGTSPDGWDSQMVEYPFVFDHQGRRFMLFNGNGFGATGIGLAEFV